MEAPKVLMGILILFFVLTFLAFFLFSALRSLFSPLTPTPQAVQTPPPSQTILQPSPAVITGTVLCNSGNMKADATLTTGTTEYIITLKLLNQSNRACNIEGIPGVQIQESAGNPLSITSYVPTDTTRALLLKPGGIAYLDLRWRNWCGQPLRSNLVIALALPQDTTTLLTPVLSTSGQTVQSTPSCEESGLPSTLNIGAFR